MKSLEPLSWGKLTLKNRLVLLPMGTDCAEPGVHAVTPRHLAYMAARARGLVGLISPNMWL